MTESNILAYCAGVIDSDGCITIKRRINKVRHSPREAAVSYAPTIFVRQVENAAVELLQATFAGSIRVHPPSKPGGRDLNQWEITHLKAEAAARLLLPFLRIKRQQAEILLEYGDTVKKTGIRKPATWYVIQDDEPMYTVAEAATLKGISEKSVLQAVRNKTVPAMRQPPSRRVYVPRKFWDSYTPTILFRHLPSGYTEWREGICQRIRSLNGPTRGIKSADRKPTS